MSASAKISAHRKLAAGLGILAITGASIIARSGSALSSPEGSSSQKKAQVRSNEYGDDTPEMMSFDDHFASFVRAALDMHSDKRTDLRSWEQSGYMPSDIVANAAANPTPGKAFVGLCHALKGIDDASLALFQNELSKPETLGRLPCADALSARLSDYWAKERAELQSESDRRHEQSPTLSRHDASALRTQEVHVDASKGPLLSGSPEEGYLKEGEIALTFDDGSNTKTAHSILKTLKLYGVRANFFASGTSARANSVLIKTERASGHSVGSSTFTHSDMTQIALHSLTDVEQDMQRGRAVLESEAGVETPFFRFPYGAHNADLDQVAAKQRLATFSWNMDSEDWKRTSPVDLFHHLMAELDDKHGGILLLHDTQEQTAIVLPFLLDELRHRGWTTVVFVPH